ncbi:MAG: serine hydrolase [Myxococcales bacterium]|nr:serine hydrolase [Myxococcales bacterium]
MVRRFGRSALVVSLAAAFAPLGCQQEGPPVAMPTGRPAHPEQVIGKVLDGWHAAAARADENAYFAAFAKNGVFMGTDATERWDVAAFRAYAHPFFAKGKAWSFRPVKRTVTMAPGGESAWFDEDLDTPNLGPARGTGVVVRDGATYKIAQYNLSVPIPNDRFKDVKRLIAGGGGGTTPKLAAASAPTPAFTDPERDKKLLATLPKIEALVKSEHESRKLPSLAVALVVDGRVVLSSVHGYADVGTKKPATADTVYRIGSITKTFTTAALLVQRDKGRLSLEDRLDRWLPEAGALEHEPRDARAITLRDIVSHASGLPRLGDFDYTRPDHDVTEAEVLGAIPKARVHAPGTAYLYSNFGMGLLGIVVGRAGGKPYRDVVREALLTPLGMTSSGFDPKALPPGALATGYKTRTSDKPEPAWRLGASEGAGGMYASLSDMAKWVAFHADAWPARDDAETGPLARASRREAHAMRFFDEMTAETRKDGVKVDATGVGYAWHVRQTCAYEKLVEHGGAIDGFNAQVSFAPDRGFGVVVLTNALDGGAYPIADKVLDLVAAEGALPPRQTVPTRELTDLVARFADKMSTFDAASYEAIFADSFRRAIPLEKIQEINAVMAKSHGACAMPSAPESVASPTNAKFRLKCTHGTVLAQAVAQGGKLVGFTVESAGLPAPKEVGAAAAESLALVAKWDAARFKKAFAAQVKEEDLKAGFEKQRSIAGACKVTGPGEGDGVRRATFPMACDKAQGKPWEVVVGLDKEGKVNEVFFRPKAQSGRCH